MGVGENVHKILMERKKGCVISILILGVIFLCLCGFVIWGVTTTYYGISISPNGKILVITTPRNVAMYRLEDAKKLNQVEGQPYGRQDYQGEFSYIAWSPDGASLAVGKLYNGIWIWDVNTWELLTERNSEGSEPRNEPSFAWSPDGKQLAWGNGQGEVWIWDKNKNTWILEAPATEYLISIVWRQDGQLLRLNDHSLYDVKTGNLVSDLNHDIDGSGKVAWSLDGSHVYVFFDLGGGVMDVKANKYEFGAGAFPEFAWSLDGRYFASASDCDNKFYVWDTMDNKIVRQDKQGNVIYSLTWAPNGDLVALGVLDWQTVVWNTNTGEVLMNLHKPPNLYCVID